MQGGELLIYTDKHHIVVQIPSSFSFGFINLTAGVEPELVPVIMRLPKVLGEEIGGTAVILS
jgi:hypothetical protein